MAELAMFNWLTDSGRLTHKVIIRPASSLPQDTKSSPVKDQRSTTVLRRQQGENQPKGTKLLTQNNSRCKLAQQLLRQPVVG